jgi:hypothetical protein
MFFRENAVNGPKHFFHASPNYLIALAVSFQLEDPFKPS